MKKWCGRRACNGRHGPTTIRTGLGPAWRISRIGPMCCRGRSPSPRSVSSACSAMPISALPIAAGLKETEADVHAVVIARHGKLVFEQYFPGYDDPWGAPEGQFDFDARTKHDMRSVSKSVISLLVGIAIDRKLIADPQQPVVK